MMTVGYVALGAFALVFVVFPAALLLADRIDPWVHKQTRRIWRDLAARYWTRRGYVIVAYRPAIRRTPAVWTVEKRVDGICTTKK